MSVLYKALQKAAKENEQRQAAEPQAAGFDPARLAGSGVIRAGASRATWRYAALGFLLVAAAAMGAAYYFTVLAPGTTQVAVAPRPAPPAVTPPPAAPPQAAPNTPPTAAPPQTAPAQTATAPAAPATQPPVATPAPAETAVAQAPPASAEKAAPPATAATPVPAAKDTRPAESRLASASPPPARAPAKPISTREPMPKIAADSPARMLDPPINIHRGQIDLEGAGSAVKVRSVSQAARDSVGAGYNALIRGQYDTALGFYSEALKQEPHSVLAFLGRGAALQRLGRKDEARAAYEQALKYDSENREALTNMTALEAERAPGEALARLIELEHTYPGFSPIKAQIGMVYARLNNLDGALDYLRRALAITPEATLYQFNLALVLDRLGHREEAVAAYQQVLASMNAGRSLPELSAADIQRRVEFLRSH